MNIDINTINTTQKKVEEENIELLPSEEIDEIETSKKYTFEEILKSSSCVLSKEKNYIWKNVLFSEKFYDILTTKETEVFNKYTDIYPQIDNILMGNFNGAKERTNYYKGFYYLSYLLNIKYNNIDNIQLLFVIYYSTIKEKPEYSIEFLEFLEITDTKDDLGKALNYFNYINKYSNSDLECDKQCFLDSNIFFSKIGKESNGVIIHYPNSYEIINKSDKIKKVVYMGDKRDDIGFVDINKLIPKSYVFESVLNILRKKEILDYDLFFGKKIINFTFKD